ncbi:MAG: hypothetical protein CM1200mP30_28530 [Pseudomonadota bacterium]|nr:MAG: hypothetical protein CM1200mP30_28530 [Pseudomonadota bacterium]
MQSQGPDKENNSEEIYQHMIEEVLMFLKSKKLVQQKFSWCRILKSNPGRHYIYRQSFVPETINTLQLNYSPYFQEHSELLLILNNAFLVPICKVGHLEDPIIHCLK